jgi:hypothetical protein
MVSRLKDFGSGRNLCCNIARHCCVYLKRNLIEGKQTKGKVN